jgi:hypothetical protein
VRSESSAPVTWTAAGLWQNSQPVSGSHVILSESKDKPIHPLITMGLCEALLAACLRVL